MADAGDLIERPDKTAPLSGTNTGDTTVNGAPPNSGNPPAAGTYQTDPINAMILGPGGNIYQQTGDMVNTPSAPVGAVVNPVHQVETAGPNGTTVFNNGSATPNGAANATQANSNPNTTASQANGTILQQQAQAAQAQTGYAAEADTRFNVQDATAAQGQVHPLSTVAGQLGLLMNFDPNTAPAWAKGASAMANDQLAARGMGASSIAGAAITQAIMQAGIPIAQADAQTFAQMDLTNLNNEQTATLQNAQERNKALFSDQAATNAARQFNAQSGTQTAQFFANLMATSDQFNVTQANAMKQQSNQINSTEAVENAKNSTAISQFNAEQTNAMQKFYDGNQLIVDQSNAQWRRDINTANTTADNNANQINAANLLAISNTAMNNIWQASRDYASWVQQSSENEKDRNSNMAIAVFNQQSFVNNMSQEQQNSFFASLGGFALDLIKGFVTKPAGTP